MTFLSLLFILSSKPHTAFEKFSVEVSATNEEDNNSAFVYQTSVVS
jgi:hypothetical protein